MQLTLDRSLLVLLIALGCAHLVSPVLAGVLASVVILVVAPLRLSLGQGGLEK